MSNTENYERKELCVNTLKKSLIRLKIANLTYGRDRKDSITKKKKNK